MNERRRFLGRIMAAFALPSGSRTIRSLTLESRTLRTDDRQAVGSAFVDPGLNMKGSWNEICAITQNDLSMLRVECGAVVPCSILLDVAVGPVCAEIVMHADIYFEIECDPATWLIPTSIPAGSRIAVRAESACRPGPLLVVTVVVMK